jgi:hypothetical protein
MADIEKRLNKAAVKKATSWGTAVDTDAAGMGFLPLNPGAPKAAVQMIEDESYGAFETNLDVGLINPTDFSLDFDYRWDGRENLLLAMLMGTAGLPGMYFIVSAANNKLDFGEGGSQIEATLSNGTYTAAALCAEIKAKLDASVGALTYTVTHDATTRKFTISAGGNFELKWFSGTSKATDCSTLLGYSDAADDTGAATYTSDVAGVGIALNYLHSLVLLNKAFGIFGTYATEKGTKIHTVPTFKVLKGSFSVNAGLIKAAFNLRGIKVVDDSALPVAFTSTTVDGNTHARAKFTQAVFQMNAQTGLDFDGGGADIIRPKSFTLEIERKMDSEHVAGVQTIVEPVENDKPSVKLTMEFPRMDTANAAYFAEWIAATEKKADLIITGPAIEGGYNYYLKFQFPRLIIEDVEYADSKIIPAKIVLRGVTADSPGPTGMTGLTLPVYVGLMNGRSADYLA